MTTGGSTYDPRWWMPQTRGEDRGALVVQHVRKLRDRQGYRNALHLHHARLYGDMAIAGFAPGTYVRIEGANVRLALNVVANCVDALNAQITSNRVRPMFLTSRGDWGLQERAKGMQQFVEGSFYQSGVRKTTPRVFTDAAVFGLGAVKTYVGDPEGEPRVVTERIFPGELMVDDREAMYGEPRSLYQSKYVDRGVLEATFPKHAKAIREVSSERGDGWGMDAHADQLLVIEAWRLRSGARTKDGRHVIAIESATLLDEEWTREGFPFCILRLKDPLLGWWGVGIAQALTGIQFEINKLLREIQHTHHLLGKSHWMVEDGSKVVATQLNNDIGAIIRYSGMNPPQVYTPQVIAPDIYAHLWNLYREAYQIIGISQLSAQSQKPAGINSGEGLRVYNNIETRRFVTVGQRWEEFHLDVARQHIELAREIASKRPDMAVTWHDQSTMRQVKWADVHLEAEAYVLKAFPTSALPSDPAGRIERLEQLANAGWVSPAQAKRLLEFPDLDAEADLENAPYDLLRETLERLIETGEYEAPEPFQDLALVMQLAPLIYQRAKLSGVDEGRLELLRRYMDRAAQLMAPPEPPMPPPGEMPPDAGPLPGPELPPGPVDPTGSPPIPPSELN